MFDTPPARTPSPDGPPIGGASSRDDGLVLESGGTIPGLSRPAFTIQRQRSARIPVLIAVPHAGRAYPVNFAAGMRDPDVAPLRLEDRFVDSVGKHAAALCGAALLIAHAPRAMIDLNRDPHDLDLSMFTGTDAEKSALRRKMPGGGRQSSRANRGLGLFPRRLTGLGELWRRPLTLDEGQRRIAAIHAPYHDALDKCLGEIRREWGQALLLDLHSMPSLPQRAGLPPPTHIVGDRFGASAGRSLVEEALLRLEGDGAACGYNRPYAGGYVLERHGRPRAGVHAVQLEIARDCYLDEQGRIIAAKVEEQGRIVAGMISAMIERMSGDCLPQAAE